MTRECNGERRMTITNYQAKKWAKGASQIVIGVLLLITLFILLDKLTLAPQQVRDSSLMGLITMLIIFVIVWCFVSAAVSIIAGFIGKKQVATLTDIGKRIDDLEKNLQSASFITAAAAGSAAIKPEEKMEKSSKKVKVAVAAVVVILVIAAIAAGLVLFAFNTPPSPGGETPEQALNTFLDRMNLKDADGAVGQTVWTLADNRSDYVSMLDTMLSSGFNHATITSGPDKFLKSDLNSTERAEKDARINYLESKYNVDVLDYVVFEFELSVSITGQTGPMTVSARMPCVLIEDKWYIDAESMFNDGGNGGNGGGQIEVKVSKNGPSGGNWTVSVDSVSNTSSLSTSQVYLEVMNSTGVVILQSKQLSSMTPGVYDNGVLYQDIANSGELDQSDEFVLDEAIYGPGSTFRLTDQPGSTTFAEIAL